MAFTDDNPVTYMTTYLQLDADGTGAIAGAVALKKYLLIEIEAGADLPNLTAAEGAKTGGTSSWRKVVYELVNMIWTDYNGMATADRPDNITVTRSSLIDTTTAGEASRTISLKAILNTSTLDVAAE